MLMLKTGVLKIQKTLKNKAVRGTLIVASSSMIGSVFSYLVQIFLGRNLSVAEYGIFNTLLSVSIIIGVLTNTFMTSIVKMVSNLKVKEKFDTLTHLFIKISLAALGIGMFFATLIFALKSQISGFLNIREVSIISTFAVYMSTPFLRVPPISYLQGLLRFKGFAFTSVIYTILKLVAAVSAVYLGYRVGGVFVIMGIFSAIGYFVGVLVLKKNFESFDSNEKLDEYYKKVLAFAGPVLFMQIGMILLNNVDIILVKHLFDEYTAGIYSGLVTVAKVFLFAANTIVIVMFPQVSDAFARGEDVIRKVKPFFLIQVFVIMVGLIIFATFPGLIVDIMFGNEYLGAVKYLPKFTVFFGLYVMLNFSTLFLLAIEKTKVYLFQIPALLLQIGLIYTFHDSLDQVINMNLITATLLLVLFAIYYLKNVGINNNSGV
jgi:O-antigen/teichoic acid export membrane protein